MHVFFTLFLNNLNGVTGLAREALQHGRKRLKTQTWKTLRKYKNSFNLKRENNNNSFCFRKRYVSEAKSLNLTGVNVTWEKKETKELLHMKQELKLKLKTWNFKLLQRTMHKRWKGAEFRGNESSSLGKACSMVVKGLHHHRKTRNLRDVEELKPRT